MKKPSKQVRTRIAPSPTGLLHFGTLRTALFNYLFAKNNGGEFIVRIEDTDKERSNAAFEKNILDGIAWAGLEWDEGPDNPGKFGPYRQSERGSVYEKYFKILQDSGQAYEKEGALHLKLPEDIKELTIKDLIRGEVTFDITQLNDIVIRKSDGTPTFMFANALDDALMEISHVIRGEDHLSNTPKQVIIYRALGFEPPEFAHLPLILNPDRSKMSKRAGDVDVDAYIQKGYLPEALINFMVFLGWNPKTTEEIFSLAELEKRFDIAQVNKAGAVFDIKRLNYLNNKYVNELSEDDFVTYCKNPLLKAGLVEENDFTNKKDREYLGKILDVIKDRTENNEEIAEQVQFFFKPAEDYDASKVIWKKSDKDETIKALAAAAEELEKLSAAQYTHENIEKAWRARLEKEGIEAGSFLWPVRYALSHEDRSPGAFEMAAVLGKKESMQRIKETISKLEKS
ncbi:glutamate--tRNA ligase [Patescibacteria group bacterium]